MSTATVKEKKLVLVNDVDEKGRHIVRTHIPVNRMIDVFRAEDNVRDKENLERAYNLSDFAAQIGGDGGVRENVHVAIHPETTLEDLKKLDIATLINLISTGDDPNDAPGPLAGFRRTHALNMACNTASLRGEALNEMLPVTIHLGFTSEDMIQWKLDHDSQKGLNDFEVMNSVRKMEKSGRPYKKEEIVWAHRNLFAANTTSAVREEWYNKCSDIRKEATDKKWPRSVTVDKLREVTFKTFKGRFQKAQRVALTRHSELEDMYRAYVYGEPHEPTYNTKRSNAGWNLDRDEFNAMYKEWIEEDRTPPLDDGRKPWTQKILDKKIPLYHDSTIFGTILSGVAGDEEAQTKFITILDDLVRIEKARKVDEVGFEKFITGQLAKATN